MPEYYVSFVKEYLELQGFVVRTETKYPMKEQDRRGIVRTSGGDLDILACKIKDNKIDELIVGEVKAESQTKNEVQKIDQNKFENPHIKQKLMDLFGSTNYKKCLYCWSWQSKTREFAQKLGITPISFGEMVNYMLKSVKEHKGWLYLQDYPNLMLLQFLQTKYNIEKNEVIEDLV